MATQYLVIQAGSARLPIAVTTAGQAAPTGLAAVNSGFAARNDLTWGAASGATSYVVERSPHGAGTWAAVTFPGVIAGTSWADPGLSASTAYDYRVSAVGAGGTSAPSATSTATTATAGSPPGSALGFNAAAFSSSAINMCWEAASGASYYVVSRSTDATSYLPVAVATSGVVHTDGAALAPGTAYYYRHRSGNAGGETYTDPATPNAVDDGGYLAQATWPSGAPTIPSPSLGVGYPTSSGLCAAPLSSSSIQVRWGGIQAPEGSEATSYILQRSPDDSTWTQIATPPAGTWAHEDTGLSAGTTYHFRFAAVGAGGTSAFSASVSAATPSSAAGRRLLRREDFTYLGGFTPPFFLVPSDQGPTIGGPDDIRSSGASSGVAFRYVASQIRILGLSNPNEVTQPNTQSFLYEYTPPADADLTTSPPFPAGTPVAYWGDPYNGKKLGLDNPPNAALNSFGTTQLLDKTDDGQFISYGFQADPAVPGRFWITYSNWYNVGGTCSPNLLRIDLTDPGTIATTGPYRFDEHLSAIPNGQKTAGGISSVPQWFADAHLNTISGAGTAGDPWRVCGFGGNDAGIAFGSMGPSAVAFNVNKLGGNECVVGEIPFSNDAGILYQSTSGPDTNPHTPLIPSVSLAGYTSASKWATRPPGLVERIAGDPYHRGDGPNVGYFYATDRIKGGGCWIDDDAGTRGKHGLLIAGAHGYGYYDYKGGNVFTGVHSGGQGFDGGQAIAFTVIDPADLASVAGGTMDMGDVPLNPPNWWLPDLHGADQRRLPFTGDFQGDAVVIVFVSGMAFDPSTNRLYVSVANQVVASGHSETVPVIHVYEIAT